MFVFFVLGFCVGYSCGGLWWVVVFILVRWGRMDLGVCPLCLLGACAFVFCFCSLFIGGVLEGSGVVGLLIFCVGFAVYFGLYLYGFGGCSGYLGGLCVFFVLGRLCGLYIFVFWVFGFGLLTVWFVCGFFCGLFFLFCG